jgi:hypothetical protein
MGGMKFGGIVCPRVYNIREKKNLKNLGAKKYGKKFVCMFFQFNVFFKLEGILFLKYIDMNYQIRV